VGKELRAVPGRTKTLYDSSSPQFSRVTLSSPPSCDAHTNFYSQGLPQGQHVVRLAMLDLAPSVLPDPVIWEPTLACFPRLTLTGCPPEPFPSTCSWDAGPGGCSKGTKIRRSQDGRRTAANSSWPSRLVGVWPLSLHVAIGKLRGKVTNHPHSSAPNPSLANSSDLHLHNITPASSEPNSRVPPTQTWRQC
jgi:hypothetical protein